MIKLYALYDQKLVTNITGFCKTVQWSGDKSQAARKLEVTLAYSIWDKNQANTQIGVGTFVWMTDEEGNELFRGMVFDREIDSDVEELKFTAFDYLVYFNKSKITYNFNNIASEYAIEKICTDLGIKYNSIPTTNININRFFKQKGAYDALMTIYTDVSFANGKQYIPIMQNEALSIIEKGQLVSNFILKPESNIGQTTYNDSIENMVNKVIVYDEKENYVNTITNDSWIATYGILQDVYNESTKKDNSEETTFLLHGVDRTIKIIALGNAQCITGYAVQTQIFYIDILQNTTLYIDADTHTWEVGTGKYTMELTLNLDNIMDRKEDGTYDN
jgi:hypothetical protein